MATPTSLTGFTAADWRWFVRTRESSVELSDDAIPFALTASYCDNPTCTCEDVTLSFREEQHLRRQAALAFDVSLDASGEQEAVVKALGEQAEELGNTVRAELRGAVRASLRTALREHRAQLRRIPATLAGYVNRGEMVPWTHVEAGGNEHDKAYIAWMDELDDADGWKWWVMDNICGNPTCACDAVRLRFSAFEEGRVSGQFDATVSLATGAVLYDGVRGLTQEQAAVVYAEWDASTPFGRAELRERYESARRLAKQGLAAGAPPARAPLSTGKGAAPTIRPPPSRRDPCPCGSGKRYKNCCGLDAR